jgi:hypothetical protein
VREKRSAHLRGLRTMWSARCAAFDVLCGTRPALSFQVSAKLGASWPRRADSRRRSLGSLRLRDSVLTTLAIFFFFWFSQSDLFDERQTRERETLPGVSGATAGVGCVREDEPAEQGAEG